jgi:hypothetical protein
MRVFADFHHDDLYHSLRLLFEKRLGWELFCPCGPEWYTNGFWSYSIEPRVIHQYLVEPKVQDTGGGYSLIENPTHGCNLKALTFDQFKEMPIDIIISSVPENEYIYLKLRNEFKPKAKLIQHWGNEWKDFKSSYIRNWLVSCAPFPVPEDVNAVFYHQEFDLSLFSFEPGDPKNPIKSFVNDLPHLTDWGLFQKYEKKVPERKWLSHGLGCRDGNIRPLTKLVSEMKSSSFIFHAKSLGDGFGHIIHNIFALGRPAIVRSKWYKNRLAEPLLLDGITCIDLDKHLFWQNVKLIQACLEPSKYQQMSADARRRFGDVVNFKEEFEGIKQFLENLS